MKKAICIMSGGMDSTLAAFMAKKEGYAIIPVHFNYGQRTQKKELEAYRAIKNELTTHAGYEIDMDFFKQIGASSLVDTNMDVPTQGIKPGVPTTYVPFRNGIFLSIAGAIAEKEGASALVIGVVEEDSSGYPDCREAFIRSIEQSINMGTKDESKVEIKMPLVHLQKSEIVQVAIKYEVPLHLTWSCYTSEEEACGICDSCRLRLNGFALAGTKDPISYKK